MAGEPSGFELRDHTADIALYVWGDSLEGLFRAAADGFYAVIGELRLKDVAGHPIVLDLEAGDVENLLHDFLSELLHRFEIAGLRLTEFVFDRMETGILQATAVGRRIDPRTSTLDREVKAVTYHDLRIERRDGRYEVTVILDI